MAQKREQSAETTKRIAELEREVRELRAKHSESAAAAVAAQKESELAVRERDAAKSGAVELASKAGTMAEDLRQVARERDDAVAAAESLRSQLASATRGLEGAETALIELSGTVNALRAGDCRGELAAAHERIDELSCMLQDSEERCGELESLLVETARKLEGSATTVANARATAAAADERCAEYELALERERESGVEARSQLAGLLDTLRATEERASTATKRVAQLEYEVEAAAGVSAQAEREAAVASAQSNEALCVAQARLATVEGEMSALQLRVSELSGKLVDSEQCVKRLEVEVSFPIDV